MKTNTPDPTPEDPTPESDDKPMTPTGSHSLL
jgi:hypothetical protein